jgi:hypothetical protein
MGASHPTRVHCWELACRDQKGIRSTIPLEFRRFKQRRETWWKWLRRAAAALGLAPGRGRRAGARRHHAKRRRPGAAHRRPPRRVTDHRG